MNKMIISAGLVAQGNQQLLQGRYLDAIASFDEAIDNNPESLDAFQGRAFCNTQLLAYLPIEEHLLPVRSIVEDLETAARLANIRWEETISE